MNEAIYDDVFGGLGETGEYESDVENSSESGKSGSEQEDAFFHF